MEKIEGKTYRELTLLQHLPNFRTINPNANEQTRTMAAFMYYILYDQITGLQKSQTGLAIEFRCQTTLFKRLITGKRQPGRPGRSGDTQRSWRQLEEVAEMEGATPAKLQKITPKPGHGRGKSIGKKGKWGWVKFLKIIGRIGKMVVRIVSKLRGWVKPSNRIGRIESSREQMTLYCTYCIYIRFVSEIFRVILAHSVV